MEKRNSKRMIEFFSGSKTVSGVFDKKGWDIFTIDNNHKLNPNMCIDIMKLTPGMLPGNVGFLWFSPVCKNFSRAADAAHWQKITNKYRQYTYFPQTLEAQKSVDMLQKVTQIIKWFPGIPFVIENPVGRIHHFPCMKHLGHYRYFVNYADFGFAYSKETYLFTNLWLPFSTKKYQVSAPGLRTVRSTFERSKVPALLVEKIYDYIF